MWNELIIPDKYVIRYWDDLHFFGPKKLIEIATAVENLPRWDASSAKSLGEGVFEFKGEIDKHMGIQYIAFPISDMNGKLAIVIDSRANFENGVTDFEKIVVKPLAQDGQHKHGNK